MTQVRTSRGIIGMMGAGLAACVSAALFLFAFANADNMLSFLFYAAPIPLFLSAMGSGRADGIMSTWMATAAVYFFGNEVIFRNFAFLFSIPLSVLFYMAMRYRTDANGKVFWYPEGRLLTLLVLYPCVIFAAANVLTIDTEGGLLGMTMQALQGVVDKLTLSAQSLSEDELAQFTTGMETIKQVMPKIAYLIPSIVGLSWAFSILACAVVAQWILAPQQWLIRDALSFSRISAPNWTLFAVAVFGLVGVLAPDPFAYIGTTLCVFMCLPIFFAGIALTHLYAETLRYPRTFLFFFYLFLSVIVWLAVGVALVGALEQSFNLRQRIAASVKTQSKS